MNDETAVEQFIEQMGLALEEDRLPRIAGRIMGLLLIEGGPLDFDQIAERLQVSRASVSTNTRLLLDTGAIQRVSQRGDRRDYFRVASAPGRELLGVVANQLKKRCRMIASCRKELSPWRREAQKRLEDLERFYAVVSRGLESMLDELSIDEKRRSE